MKPIHRVAALACCVLLLTGASGGACAAACLFEPIGEGRVAEITDARSFRLDDGREIRLAGIETAGADRAALAAMLSGQDVTLRALDETPDRYGLDERTGEPIPLDLLERVPWARTVQPHEQATDLLAADADVLNAYRNERYSG